MSYEAKISKALLEGLSREGCHAWKANDARTVGIPDIVGVAPGGRHICVETKFFMEWPKRPGTGVLSKHKVTRQQAKHMMEVWACGGLALVAVGFVPKDEWRSSVASFPEFRHRYACVLLPWSEWKSRAITDKGWPADISMEALEGWISRGSRVCQGSMSSWFDIPAGVLST